MDTGVTLAAAFAVGLLGSVHCAGMCGGIAGALGLGLPGRRGGRLAHLLAYNAGRIGSYAAAGALAGWLGAGLDRAWLAEAQWVGRYLAAAFLVALGLYLGGWWQGLAWLERGGAHLWRHLEPWGRRLLPVTRPSRALALGLVWGWLPCGLVYSALVWAATAAAPLRGAALMAAFGLGTLPMLLLLGGSAGALAAVLRRPGLRRAAGLAILLLAAYTLWGGGHGGHAAPPATPAAHVH